jgi:uncharacterized protein Veg
MLDPTLPVRVYWNYKHRCYSLFQAGAVRASARQVQLVNVTFKVRENARQRMVRENRKIIHAYASGFLVDFVHPSDKDRDLAPFSGVSVSYDPYSNNSFVCGELSTPVHYASSMRFDESGMRITLDQPAAA